MNLFIEATFIVFRFGVLIYMFLWLLNNMSNVPFELFVTGQCGLLLMGLINIDLFVRLMKSDNLSKKLH